MISTFQRVKNFLEESKRELLKVNWPTRQKTANYTLVVIGLSLALAIFLGALDFLFSYLVRTVLVL